MTRNIKKQTKIAKVDVTFLADVKCFLFTLAVQASGVSAH